MSETGGRLWLRVMLIYGAGIFAVAVISIAVPEVGGIAREFHPHSPAATGWVISLPALVAALAALGIGWIVDSVGDRAMLIAGGLILAVGDGGVALSQRLSVLLEWRAVSGVGYVCMAVAAVTLLTRLTQGRERTIALTLWSTVIPASFIVAFLGGSVLLVPGQWRAAFAWHAAICLVLTGLAWACLPARAPGERVVARTAGVGLVLRSRWPYILGLSFAANACLQTGVIASLPQLLSGRLGVGETQVHSFNILAMLVNIIGALGVGALLNKGVTPIVVGLGGILLSGLACVGLTLFPTTFAAAIAMNCVFMLGCGLLVGLWALLPRVAPSLQTLGATSGLITQITLVGVLFGPPAALDSLSRGPPSFLVFVACSLGASLIGLPVWLKTDSAIGAGASREMALDAH